MNKYKVKVFRVTESDWERSIIECEPLFYTFADSLTKAINNVRFRIRRDFGWKNHDEDNGSVAVRYEFEAKLDNDPKYEQLKLFDLDNDD